MSGEFDPYYTWLGIPPEEQPPDHYRLLGVRRFESNPEVISNALGQRQTHLRSFTSGERAAAAEQVLDELAHAGECLASPERKGAYDRELRQKDAPKLGRAPDRQQYAKPAGLSKSSTNIAVEAVVFNEAPAGPGSMPVPWQMLALLAAGGVGLLFLGAVVLAAGLYGAGFFSRQPASGQPISLGPPPQQPVNQLPISGSGDSPAGPANDPSRETKVSPAVGQSIPKPAGNTGPLIPVQANVGLPLDLLQYVEASQAVSGEFRKHGAGGWQTVGEAPHDVLPLQVAHLPEEYVVDTTVMRLSERADDAVLQWLVAGGRHCLVTVDGYKPAGIRTVLDGVDRKPAGMFKDDCEYRGQLLPANVPVNLKYYVFKDRLMVECEGKTVLHWTGGLNRLSSGQRFGWNDLKMLYFGASNGSFALTKFDVRPIGKLGGPTPEAIAANVQKNTTPDPAPPATPDPVVKTPEPPPPDPTPTPEPEPKETRFAVPNEADRAKGIALVQDTYKQSYEQAVKSSAEKAKLAKKLLGDAEGEPDPTVIYAYLLEARRLLLEAGEIEEAFSVIETMDSKFAIDPWQAQAETLQLALKSADNSTERKALAEQARRVAEGAVAEAEFATVREAAVIAEKLGDTKLKKDAGEWLETAKRALAQEAAYVSALEKLRALPNDGQANEICGRFLCLMKRDWTRGLPHLAKASHAALKEAAVADLAAPSTADELISLADKWWQLAESVSGEREKDSLKFRACEWYERALPTATGIKLARANKCLSEMQERAGERPSAGPRGPTVEVLPDPGALYSYAKQTGKVFYFDVVGDANGSLYGTGLYTTDSSLATAAVHSGVLKAGQAGVVKVTILPGRPNYVSTTRNGVTSTGWTDYGSSYKVESGPKFGIRRPSDADKSDARKTKEQILKERADKRKTQSKPGSKL